MRKLVIGNKNYSSWSLRPWLLMRQADLAFEEVRIPLYQAGSKENILRFSPAGKVPVLVDGEITVWDSLAICEYLAECHPEKALWPHETRARAQARAVSAEMHSGFANLRKHLPMNLRRSIPRAEFPAEVRAEIARIQTIWSDCRARYAHGGRFLFGGFCIADAMYAPVVMRFRTYGVGLEGAAREYAAAIEALPALARWIADARAEAEVLPEFEL
ncbi:MAG TPA: glutathione S-transferase family protein [Burkholderiales bacterium]|nr:glutathione S-transferase family protein [Burkholderiales bacterium]